MYRLIIPFILIAVPVFSQKYKAKKEQKTTLENLRRHVSYLADDKMEGRRAGTEGERKASDYIAQQFKILGLTPPAETTDYFQTFTIEEGRKVSDGAYLVINARDTLRYPNDFQPFAFSPPMEGKSLRFNPEIKEKGHVWKLDMSDLIEKNKDNPHFDASASLRSEIARMSALGAAAVIVTKPPKSELELGFNAKDKSETVKIPAFYMDEKTYSEKFDHNVSEYELTIHSSIVQSRRTARNVVGWIDNKAPTSIVIGAHYDHLGYGEDGNSMLRTQERLIHNGADDNASGTASMMELARVLKAGNPGTHNYVFIAFSGEELGLFGSKHYVEHPPIPIEKTSYMINLDMVGRLNDSTRTLTIGGYGTSSQWAHIVKEDSKEYGFKIRFDSSGTGPSDHTSFYRKDIPVLFFFTGLHTDYHKPTDDHEKIDYTATANIVRYIKGVIERSRYIAKLDFKKTREQQTGTSTRFSVSMGIMPDYTYSGSGVRVDGVSEGRAAKMAGIRAGDIVIRLGDRTVDSVESYMRALSTYKKGDKTKVTITRGSETITYEISF